MDPNLDALRFRVESTDEKDLRKLIGAARKKPKMKRLCCPVCSGDVLLDEGLLWCQDGQHVFKNLMELATR